MTNLIKRSRVGLLSSLFISGILISIPGYSADTQEIVKSRTVVTTPSGEKKVTKKVIIDKPQPKRDVIIVKPQPKREVIVVKPQPRRDVVIVRPGPRPIYREGYYHGWGYRWAPYRRGVIPRGARVLYFTRDGRPVYECYAAIDGEFYRGKSVAGRPCRIFYRGRDTFQAGFSIRID